MKPIIISIPLFDGKIEILTNQEATIKRTITLGITKEKNYDKNLKEIDNFSGVVYYDIKRDLNVVVYLPEVYDDVLVSHETIHIVTTIFKYYNLPTPKEGRDEIFARYHDYFMTQIKKKVYHC